MLLPYAKYSTLIAPTELPRHPIATRRYLEYTLTGLQRQATVLAELRTRASILLSATGIIAGLLGPPALEAGHPRGFLGLGLAFLTLGILACINVVRAVTDEGSLLSGRRWKVTLNQEEIRLLAESQTDEEAPVPDEILETLASAREVNHETIDARSGYIPAASVLLLLQIGCWSAVLWP
jgi:hypothetical protein